LVDEFFIPLDAVRNALNYGEATMARQFRSLSPTKITDTISELQNWEYFEEETGKSETKTDKTTELTRQQALAELREPIRPAPVKNRQAKHEPATEYGSNLKPVRSVTPRVGRNDPCPCGSGKKFKNCCRRR
jgi:uncharacterized protein YecA (UPF0149 family)